MFQCYSHFQVQSLSMNLRATQTTLNVKIVIKMVIDSQQVCFTCTYVHVYVCVHVLLAALWGRQSGLIKKESRIQ